MASIFRPKAGRAKAWITSAPVTCTRTTWLTGTTSGLVGGEAGKGTLLGLGFLFLGSRRGRSRSEIFWSGYS
jgi:hypothetical protein